MRMHARKYRHQRRAADEHLGLSWQDFFVDESGQVGIPYTIKLDPATKQVFYGTAAILGVAAIVTAIIIKQQ